MQLLFITLLTFFANIACADTHNDTVKKIQIAMRNNLLNSRIEDARNDLERASSNFHSVEIELGLIQTLMQAGEYQHALGAAAHTQAEHTDNNDAAIFYAWLLAIGGHEKAASDFAEKYPQNVNLAKLRSQIFNHQLNSEIMTTSDAIQLAPFSKKLPRHFIYVQSGVLLAEGLALTPCIKSSSQQFILRNGLGEFSNARLATNFNNSDMSLLILSQPIKIKSPVVISTHLIAGRPIYIASYNHQNRNKPQPATWPQLKMDVPGIPANGTTAFTTHVPDLEPGSGLYNQAGQLIGLAGINNVVINLDNALESLKLNTAADTNPHNVDDIYEAALASSVQIFAESPP